MSLATRPAPRILQPSTGRKITRKAIATAHRAMKLLVHAIFMFCFVPLALAGICSSNTVVPFSGYKVTRRHKIRLRPLQSDSYLVLTKCHRGLPVFSRTVATPSAISEFSIPFTSADTELDFLDRWGRRGKKEQRNSDDRESPGDLSESEHRRGSNMRPGRGLAFRAWLSSFGWMHAHEPAQGYINGGIETSSIRSGTPGARTRRARGQQERIPRSRSLRTKTVGASILNSPLFETSTVRNQAQARVADTESLRMTEIKTRGLKLTGPARRWRNQPFPAPAPCLKLARRKRYARLDVVIFIPATYVGVLFTCNPQDSTHDEEQEWRWDAQAIEKRLPMATEARRYPRHRQGASLENNQQTSKLLQRASKSERQESSHRDISSPAHKFAMAIAAKDKFIESQPGTAAYETEFSGAPVCPLVADDYSAHWLSVQLHPPALVYHIPYLRSPSIWDPRFLSSETELPEWSEDVDINEAYIYSEADLAGINENLMKSTRPKRPRSPR
ncbi:hypothetical protein METBIDRAFT_11855 [Metschnikowia bicuspidata var. bicuspidata NRRL YB-4993]|uniref:Uncharacterized protein n=1 Tax=Metschnikowia bicuspidata var. bicuspidata NRRL YB-4993 TaxID=869754 RepID=A0A1A0HBF7_9ASCO|nr:hypothetical protein METBIDRAFT_11855 [Metschnikowia bicuspidata var. bicuspidata NRRL YB-4993]OBA21320.1 hypothetical protein METBIDRAFT_11855 [Metschnikowia bicuspidata var. bicuspidata NRRL YB-4993]